MVKTYPFGALVTQLFRELERNESVFGLPASRFFPGNPYKNFSVQHHRNTLSSPLGVAAGPHTLMAQNLVLGWLAGARFFELKTIGWKEPVKQPRPYLDLRTMQFSLDHGRALDLETYQDEMVKGYMLIQMIEASGLLAVAVDFDSFALDVGIGDNLDVLEDERIRAFVSGLQDTRAMVDRLRRDIPPAEKRFSDLDYGTRLATGATISCSPATPVEPLARVALHVLREHHLPCTLKFNPTLLGHHETHRLLHDQLGYEKLHVPSHAFADGLRWEDMVELMNRLGKAAAEEELGVAARFSGALPVNHPGGVLPTGPHNAFASGPPVHVLAMEHVKRFRREFENRFPLSFSGGIDRANFAEAVALGLAPITVCTDLMKPGGYGRLATYHRELAKRMTEMGASTVDAFIIRAYDRGADALEELDLPPAGVVKRNCLEQLRTGGDLRQAAGEVPYTRWVQRTMLHNTRHYLDTLASNTSYHRTSHETPPEKVNSHLTLFACQMCEECVHVCPHHAVFQFRLGVAEIPSGRAERTDWGWTWSWHEPTPISSRQQIGIFVDLCDGCGNCDTFCPEHGGPFRKKHRFFGSETDWRQDEEDGFFISLGQVQARIDGVGYTAEFDQGRASYKGPGFLCRFQENDMEGTLAGEADGEVDFTPYYVMALLRWALLDPAAVNYLHSLDTWRNSAPIGDR
jgi:putative selenate reductase